MKILKKVLISLGIIALTGIAYAATLPNAAPAIFETYVATQQASTDNTLTLNLNRLSDGSSISGYQCFTIDQNTPQLEYECGIVSGTSVTNIQRGIDFQAGTSTIANIAYPHRRGADIKITDYPILTYLLRALNGADTLNNVISYSPTAATSSIGGGNIVDAAYVQSQIGIATSTFVGTDTDWKISGGFLTPTTTISVQLATTTTGSLNGTIVVDGINYQGTTVGIQSAEDTCNAAGGGSVYLPTGTYNITSINMHSNCPIVGAGTSTIVNLSGFFGMKFSAVSGTGLYNLHLDGLNQTAQGIFAKEIEIVNSSDINVDHVTGTNAYGFGTFTEASGTGTTTRINFTNDHFEGLGNNDVYGGGPATYLGTVSNVTYSNDYCAQNVTGIGSYQTCFDMVAGTGYKVNNSIFYGDIRNGIEVSPHFENEFTNNHQYPSLTETQSQLRIDEQTNATTSDQSIKMEGNIIENGAVFATGLSGVPIKDFDFSNNIIKQCSTGQSCIFLNFVQGWTVENNTLHGITSGAVGSGFAGVHWANSTEGIIAGNKITNVDTCFSDDTGVNSIQIYGNNCDVYNTYSIGVVGSILQAAHNAVGWGIGTSTPSADATIWGSGQGTIFNTITSASSTALTVLNTGNVAIGTTSALYKLSVNGDIRASRLSSIGFFSESSEATRAGLVSNTNNDLIFQYGTGPTEGMRILGNGSTAGNVGIGSTTPGSLLSIGSTNGINFTTATSTFGSITGGINLATGCYAINGICVGVSSGTVTSVSGSGGTTGLTLTGGPISTSGTLTLGGTLTIANGGTATTTGGVTNGVEYYNGSTLTNSNNLIFNGTNFGVGTTTPAFPIDVVGAINSERSGTNAQTLQMSGGDSNGMYLTASSTLGNGKNLFISNIEDNSSKTNGNIYFRTGLAPQPIVMTINAAGLVGIGSTTPNAFLSVQSGSSISPLLSISTSSTKTNFRIDSIGNQVTDGDTPVVSTCGTNPSVVGDNTQGQITTGSGVSLTACTLTFADGGYPSGSTMSCQSSTNSTLAFGDITSVSNTAVTFGFSGNLISGIVYYHCGAHINN